MKKVKERKCPYCGKIIKGNNPAAIICPCEVAPKYDADYEEWKNK